MPGLSSWYEGDRIEDLAKEREALKPMDPEEIPEVPEEETPSDIPQGLVGALRSGPMPQNYDDLFARYSQAASKVSMPDVAPERNKDRALLGLSANLADISQNVSRVGSKMAQGQNADRLQNQFKQEDAQAKMARDADMDEFKTLGSMAQLGRGLMNDQAKYQQMGLKTEAKAKSDETRRMALESYLNQNGAKVPPGMSVEDLAAFSRNYMKPKQATESMSPLDRARLGLLEAQTKKTLREPTENQKPPTAEQSSSALYARRLEQAEAALEDIDKTYDRTSQVEGLKSKFIPESLQSEPAKLSKQAERNFVTALLRKESGASISPTEFETAEKQYFPRAGDTPAVLEQKKRNRQQAIEGFKSMGGKAYGQTKLVGPAPKVDLTDSDIDNMSEEELKAFLGQP